MKRASLKRLALSKFKLNCLLNITQAINTNLPTGELLSMFARILTNELNIGKVLVYSYNNGWQKVLSCGYDENKYKNINVKRDLLKYTDITNITSSSNKFLNIFDFIIPVYHKDIPLAYVLIGDIEEERGGMSPAIKHLGFIQTLANIIIVAIENKRLYKENLRREAIKKEMELASKVQSMLIPDPHSLPKSEEISVAVYYKPHFEIGGDYYDFIKLNKDKYGFCIADVSGKGVSAALLMSNLQASLRAIFSEKISLNNLVKKLNTAIFCNAKGESFITLFVGKYNCKTRKLQYINAGHNPPIFFEHNNKKIKYLDKGCVGLGMFERIPRIAQGTIEVKGQASLICFTDGLIEVENKDNKAFGTREIEKSLMKYHNLDRVINDIMLKLNEHKGERNFPDDISIMAIEFFVN